MYLVIPQVGERAYQVEDITYGLLEQADKNEVDIYHLRDEKYYRRIAPKAWTPVDMK